MNCTIVAKKSDDLDDFSGRNTLLTTLVLLQLAKVKSSGY